MKVFVLLLIHLAILICATRSARILGIFPAPSPSHHILGSSLLKDLAERGHDVTMVSAFNETTPPKNGRFRTIVLKKFYEQFQEQMKQGNFLDKTEWNPFIMAGLISFMMSGKVETILQEEEFWALINSDEKFDVVIIEQFMNDGLKVLAPHFGAPLVAFHPNGANFWVNPLTGNPSPPSYISDTLLGYSSQMSFCERVVNSLFQLYNTILFNTIVFPKHNSIVQKYFPNGPNFYDALYNASIVLLNSHPSFNQPVPQVPSMIEIGGFHIRPPKKLPQDLQEFLDGAENGVIYFSMGSNVKSTQLPVEKREILLKTFSKLKEKVLWKWEEDVLPGQPSNVKLAKWLPQQDLLAHPNIKLFITHGGLLSTTETVYHGVPILAIPVYGDQKMNAKGAVNNGYGLSVPYGQLSEEKLTATINELLNNPQYKENAKMRSSIYHDRIVPPMETAIYWIEYVIQHKGAPHLRVAALDLPWYKYHLLDVIGFLILFCLLSVSISCVVLKKVNKKCVRGKAPKKIKKN